MPLRDHFRPPLDDIASWDGLYGGWPMVIVQHLRPRMPAGFVAEPRTHSGAEIEIDVAAFERADGQPLRDHDGDADGVAWAPAAPTLAVETALPALAEYAVRVFDLRRGRRLVAAVEIVSPANKDRPETRSVFAAKCAALLRQGVAVSIVDLVTVRRFNLYAETLAMLGQADRTLSEPPPAIYAASCRWGSVAGRTTLQAWSHPLQLGAPLPTLPLWLGADRVVPIELEASYEQTCRDLWLA